MQKDIVPYIDKITNSVKQKIGSLLSDEEASINIAKRVFYFHFTDRESYRFQKYYIASINNKEGYLNSENFFATFKKQYALLGIDNSYLNELESKKLLILSLIEQGDILRLYFEYFANAKIKHGEKSVHKNLGSFFSKFTHTFKPTEYCALDNPIKNYFKLKNESFYLAFIIISNAYREFISENLVIVENIRTQLELNNIGKSFSPNFTDLKLLDLIFWFEANKDSSNH